MSKKKQKQMIEDVPVDKMDVFLAQNYKKLLIGIAAILVLFLAGYAYKTMSASRNELLVNKVGQLEMLFTFSGGAESEMNNYLAAADEYPAAGDYINLKAAELLVVNSNYELAKIPLETAGGKFKELADGLRFDTGIGSVNPDGYLTNGTMAPLWYYRAYLAADQAEKGGILASFKEKYPENELLKQIERWDG